MVSTPPFKDTDRVQLGTIGAAHGVRGAVRLRSFTEDPLDIGRYGLLHDVVGKTYEIVSCRMAKDHLIVQFSTITTREEAEALRGRALYVFRNQLPDDLEEEEYYHCDLLHMRVRDLEGRDLGFVSGLFDFGAGPLLELNLGDYGKPLISFTKDSVPEVSLEGAYICVDLVCSGIVLEKGER